MKIKICSWNIAFANQLDTIVNQLKTNKNFRDIDIFCLQEASIHNGLEDSKLVASALGKEYKYFQVVTQISKHKRQANAIIWNSNRINNAQTDSFRLPGYKDEYLNPVERIVKNFLPNENRNCVVIDCMVEKKSLRIFNGHFELLGYGMKKNQLNKIFLENQMLKDRDIVIVTGDLNTLSLFKKPKWSNIKSLSNSFGFTELTRNIGWTFRIRSLGIKQNLDKIFIKTNYKYTYKVFARDISGSDHIPIFVKLDI